MQVRSSHVVTAVAVASVLALAVAVFLNHGAADALLLTVLVAVLTGLYTLRRHARAQTVYRRQAGPRSETVSTGKEAS
jgi:4-hydroxybenzoate polyprenyltransferase